MYLKKTHCSFLLVLAQVLNVLELIRFLKMEVVVTSECSGQLWNTCIWEPLTGTTLRTFKGGISASQSLNIVGGDYLLSSLKDKPIIQVYA